MKIICVRVRCLKILKFFNYCKGERRKIHGFTVTGICGAFV